TRLRTDNTSPEDSPIPRPCSTGASFTRVPTKKPATKKPTRSDRATPKPSVGASGSMKLRTVRTKSRTEVSATATNQPKPIHPGRRLRTDSNMSDGLGKQAELVHGLEGAAVMRRRSVRTQRFAMRV